MAVRVPKVVQKRPSWSPRGLPFQAKSPIMNVDKKAYLSALALAENIVVTCDSSSMISEAAITGKPIYIAGILPKKNDKRFQRFRNLFRELNIIRNLGEEVEDWNYQKLDETNRVADIIKQKINF